MKDNYESKKIRTSHKPRSSPFILHPSSFFRFRLPYRLVGSFKGVLFIGAVAIVLAVVLYTNKIVSELREHSRRYVTLKVERFQNLFTQGDDAALDAYLREMATKDFPLIVADTNHKPTSWSGLPELEELPDSIAFAQARELQLEWQRQGNKPVSIEISEYGLKFYFYYGDSDQIRRLRYLPWILVTTVGGLILIGYFGFVNIKKSEERSVWIGMARETAHQMGTPLMSLLGWLELLDESSDVPTVRREMQCDIDRLNVVAERFNRIGSNAPLTSKTIEPIMSDAVAYIHRRLPQLAAGEVHIETELADNLTAKVNPDLFGWVMENLLRNGVEALKGKGGRIKVHAIQHGKRVILDVIDNGSGINRSDWRNIFRPGYSTKKRGWGLGLSLARRIVEDVHHGRILVLESKIDRGTTIRVQLPTG